MQHKYKPLIAIVQRELNRRNYLRLSDIQLYQICFNLQTLMAFAEGIVIYPEIKYKGATIIMSQHTLVSEYTLNRTHISHDWIKLITCLQDGNATIELGYSGVCIDLHRWDYNPNVHWRELLCNL